jgi:probable HAF family extracellular repeat protein
VRAREVTIVALAALAFAALLAPRSSGVLRREAAASWTIRELVPVGGVASRALALNERGQVAGSSSTAAGPTHAVLWGLDGRPVDLGTLGGTTSGAEDVNNAGQVAGTSTTTAGPNHAFLWTAAARLRDVGTLGGANSYGHAVNDAGTVAGYSELASGSGGHAFSWTAKGGRRDLGTLGGSLSFGNAINAFGTIVGASDLPESTRLAPAAWRSRKPASLGLPAAFDYGFAYGVSFTGQATGSLETSMGADAFLFAGGRLADIGRLGDFRYTKGLAVNTGSEVVGIAFQSPGGLTRAFVWRGGTASDLNTVLPTDTPWTLTAANDVNDLGQIVGIGTLGGETRAFLLSPPAADQAANLAVFVRALEPGSTAFERKVAALVSGRKCAGLGSIPKLARKERKLGTIRRNALVVRAAALARNVGC